MLEYVIEGFLMGYNLTGYDIKQNLDNFNWFSASYGSIYPALKKLEADGLIRSTEMTTGGKYKKVYSINDTGKDRFLQWLQRPIDIHSENEHLIKLFFYQYLTNEQIHSQVTEYIKGLNTIIRRTEVLKSVSQQSANPFHLATISFRIDDFRFLKEWHENFLAELT